MSLIRSTAWSGLAAIVLSGGRFLFAILLARQIPVDDFGRFTFTQWLVDMVFMVCAYGLDGATTRYFAEYVSRPGKLREFQRWFARRAVPVVVAVAVASPLAAAAFGQDFDATQTILQGTWSLVSAIWALLMCRAMGLKLFRRIAVANVGYIAVLVVGVLVLPAVSSVTLDSAMAIMIAATAVQALLLVAPLPASTAAPEALDRAHLRQFAFNIWIATVVSVVVWQRGELSVVRVSSDAAEVALYAAALQLASLTIVGTLPLTAVIAPHITSLWGEGRRDEAVDVARRATDWLLLAAAMLGTGLLTFAPEIVSLAFGDDFAVAHESLAVLGVGTLGLAGAASIQLVQLASNARVNRNANAIAASALIAASFVMVWWLGVVGAALARSAVWLASGAAFMGFATLTIDRRAVSWRNVIVTAAGTAAVFALLEVVEPPLVARAALWLGLCAGLALGLRDDVTRRSLLGQAWARLRARA